MKNYKHIFTSIAVITVLGSCLSLKKYPEGKYYLSKNVIQKNSVSVPNEEINSIIKQKPNRKILGVLRMHQGIYNMGNTGDTTVAGRKGLGKFWARIKRGMRTIGEEPVFLDSTLTKKTDQQLTVFIQKKGYFNSSVKDSLITHKKKVKVIYQFVERKPYIFKNIFYSTKDSGIDTILSQIKNSSLLLSGRIYDEDLIDKERDRVTAGIRDHGYYFFNKNYITVELDTSLNSHQVDVFLYVNRLYENTDPALNITNLPENHHPYKFNRIWLLTNYDSKESETSSMNDTIQSRGYYFVGDLKKIYIRKNAVLYTMFIHPQDYFLQSSVDHTYSRLADLGVFKFINFRFKEVPRDELQTEYLLDVSIQLTPNDKQEYKVESELTHNGGNLGVAGGFSYQNKNLFRGAETLELKLSGGLESLRNFADSLETKRLFFFNTYDIGPELNIGVKRFLLPGFIRDGDTSYFSPRTFISTGINYQERPDYRRNIAKFSYNLSKKVSSSFRYQLNLFEINAVKVNLGSSFYDKLISTHDVNLIYSYRDHLITSGKISFFYTTQTADVLKNFTYVRLSTETAGNSAWLFRNSYGAPDSTGKYYLFGLKFAQYIKPDVDISFHQKLNLTNTLVYRLAGGIGFSYLNSKDEILPFDKAFFAGGANDIRAWQARTLGPGAYSDPLNIETGGDIKLEANVELRSVIFKILEAAAFADAGNVWTRSDRSGLLPGSEFQLKKMPDQIAMGVGVGFRFNFTFFIMRTDFAVKMHDPALPEHQRWVYSTQKFGIKDVVPSLAIGYPF